MILSKATQSIFLLMSLVTISSTTFVNGQSYPSSNCVFIGCSCGEDAYREVLDSIEQNSIYSPSFDNNAIGPVHASAIAYEISCHDEYNPTARMTTFPLRDTSRRYSHQVSTLELNDNEIEFMPANQLDGLEIIIADLSANNLQRISPNAFDGVIKLEILDLSKNRLRDLDEQTFQPIETTLIQLKLTSNELNYTNIDKLGRMLSRLKRLTFLGLRHNHLTRMPDLSKMSRLEELAFESNMLESLGEETGASLLPSTLVDLRLENNRLRHIHDQTFANPVNLKYLNLASNLITSISENAFTRLTQLHTLNLRKNQLNHIPSRIFYTLINLERIDLSSQHQILKKIEDFAFDRASNDHTIRKIDLSNNRIANVASKAFCSRNPSHPYVNIKEIDLASNHLQAINACQLRQLAKGYSDIRQHHNHNSRPRVSFKSSSQTNELANSPMRCDCEITKAVHYVDFSGQCENSDGALVYLKNYKCDNDAAVDRDTVETLCFGHVDFDCKQHMHDDYSTSHRLDGNTNQSTQEKDDLIEGGQEENDQENDDDEEDKEEETESTIGSPSSSNDPDLTDSSQQNDADKLPVKSNDGTQTPSSTSPKEKNLASKGPSAAIGSHSNSLVFSPICSFLFAILAALVIKQSC